MTNYPAKCVACGVALEGPADLESHDMLSCPSCGVSDKLENVMREISEQVAEITAQAIETVVEGTLPSTEFVSISKDQGRRQMRRFMIDYDPRQGFLASR